MNRRDRAFLHDPGPSSTIRDRPSSTLQGAPGENLLPRPSLNRITQSRSVYDPSNKPRNTHLYLVNMLNMTESTSTAFSREPLVCLSTTRRCSETILLYKYQAERLAEDGPRAFTIY
jgi:hypothetical protein